MHEGKSLFNQFQDRKPSSMTSAKTCKARYLLQCFGSICIKPLETADQFSILFWGCLKPTLCQVLVLASDL